MPPSFILLSRYVIIILLVMIVYFNVEQTFKNEPTLVRCRIDQGLPNNIEINLFDNLIAPTTMTPPTTKTKVIYDVIETLQMTNQFVCPLKRRPDASSLKIIESVWQLHRHLRGDVYLYSAYYDNRPLAGSLPTVRIIVLATYYGHMLGYCHLWYKSLEQPYVVRAMINETGMNQYTFGNKNYREYTYTCHLDVSNPIPTHVSVTSEQCEPYSNFVKIGYEFREKPLHDFGACVANGHGHYKPEEMVEWFELNMMFGIAEFNLYDTMYINMSNVFKHYQTKGVLRMFGLVHPLNMTDKWYSKVRNLRTVALNDCMLRNMYRYKYLVVVDHDEVIVPKTTYNYVDMLEQVGKKLNKSIPHYSFSFRNVYYLKEFPQDLKKPRFLKTLRFRHRAKPSQPYMASKSILSPLFCYNLFNHYCYTRLPLYRGDVTDFVSPDIAGSHHYRECQKNYPCANLFKEKTLDDVMLTFEPNLTARVVPVLKHLGVRLS